MTTAGTPAPSTTCAGGLVSFNASSVTLAGGTVPANGSCTFQIAVTAATQGLYTNTIPAGALTTSGGFNIAAASAALTVDPVADLAVVKSAPASIGTGQVLNYTVSVINNGPDAANGAQFSDNVPVELTGVAAICGAATGGAACGAVNVAGNAVTSTVTTLPAGGSVTFTISGTAVGLGPITNTATVAAPGGVLDPAAGNNASSANTTLLGPDLTIAKSHAGNFTVGINAAYTITVSNGAGSLATSGVITVVDTLPAGLGYVTATGTGWGCGAVGQTVTCTTSSAIAAGTSAPPITLTVTVASTAVPSVLNTVTVSGGGEPAAAANNNTASDNTIVVAAAANTFAPDGAQTGVPGFGRLLSAHLQCRSRGQRHLLDDFRADARGAWLDTDDLPGHELQRNARRGGSDGADRRRDRRESGRFGLHHRARRDSRLRALQRAERHHRDLDLQWLADDQPHGRNDGRGRGRGRDSRSRRPSATHPRAARRARREPRSPTTFSSTRSPTSNTSAGPVSAIVVTDATPAFTLYQSAACGATAGQPHGLQRDLATRGERTGSVIWTLTGSLLSGGSGSVTYQVRVSN